MRKLLLFVGTFVAMVLTLCAQAPVISTTEYVELMVAPGAKDFSVELITTELNPVIVDWGDGSDVQSVKPIKEGMTNRLKHTFASVSQEKRTIKIDAVNLRSLAISFTEKNCVGVGTFVAPKLEVFDAGFYSNFKDSKDDYSHCPELKTLKLKTPNKDAYLGVLPKLANLEITSDFDLTTFQSISCVEWHTLDLNNFPALETVNISYQVIDVLVVPEGGMPSLKSLEYAGNETYKAENLRQLTESTTLTCVDLHGNYLSPEQLPQKNPNVTYTNKYGEGYSVKQNIAFVSPSAAINGRTVDMKYLNTISRQFGEGDPVGTKINWYYVIKEEGKEDQVAEIPTTAYTIKDGFTTFKEEAFKNGVTEIKVCAGIRNELFPELSYEDDEALLYTNYLTITNTDPVEKVAITITPSENGYIDVIHGFEDLKSGDEVNKGSKITIIVTAKDNYKVASVTVGDKVYEGDELVENEWGEVVFEDVEITAPTTISALFRDKTVATYAVTYSFPDEVAGKVTATVDGAAYESGKPVEAGKKVVFTYAKGDSKWAVESWTVDGKAVEGTKDKDTFELTVEKDAAVGMTLYNHAEQIADNQIAVRLINNGTILEVSGIAEGTQVSLYDAAGRELLSTTEHRINVTALAEGVYMVRALDQVVKVVK